MRAIILAAGVGQRLGDHGNRPKCLLRFGGRSLLERHLRILSDADITEVTICVGYEANAIRSELSALGRQDVRTIMNPRFREGSVVSLFSTAEVLRGGRDIILMDADVLYSPAVIAPLFKQPVGNRFLSDRGFEPGDEPVKLCMVNGRICEFRKVLAADLKYDDCGESVGFFSFTAATAAELADACERYVSRGHRDTPYEEAIRDLVLADPANYVVEDVTGLPWLEIDFPADIQRANQEILPRIDE